MKAKQIRFFTALENAPAKAKEKVIKPAEAPKLEGYISSTGKLVFPRKTVDQLKLDDAIRFQIGSEPGKRKLKVLYLVPIQSGQQVESFAWTKAAKSYTIAINYILQKGGLNYSQTKYTFTLTAFDYQEGIVGYELKLQSPGLNKPAYTGKPRGRKRKTESEEK